MFTKPTVKEVAAYIKSKGYTFDAEAFWFFYESNGCRGLGALRRTLRRFALTLRHVLEDVPGPENLHREKIMKALKIKRAMYFRMLQRVDKNLV